MGANDGSVLAFRQILNNGSTSLRYNIVLVSEGYTQAEIPLFQAHCRGFLRKLFWTVPYDTLRCTFNVFALEVASTASGIDDPPTCGDMTTGSGAMPLVGVAVASEITGLAFVEVLSQPRLPSTLK